MIENKFFVRKHRFKKNEIVQNGWGALTDEEIVEKLNDAYQENNKKQGKIIELQQKHDFIEHLIKHSLKFQIQYPEQRNGLEEGIVSLRYIQKDILNQIEKIKDGDTE